MNVQSSFNVTATSRDPPDALQSVGERLGSGPRSPTGPRRKKGRAAESSVGLGDTAPGWSHSQKAAALELHLAKCLR